LQNFNTTPPNWKSVWVTLLRQDGSLSNYWPTGGITWSVDRADLARAGGSTNIGAQPNEVVVAPILPAAQSGGVVIVSGTFVNENAVRVGPIPAFTVTIVANVNPTVGFSASELPTPLPK
jgi:hypothetical protein